MTSAAVSNDRSGADAMVEAIRYANINYLVTTCWVTLVNGTVQYMAMGKLILNTTLCSLKALHSHMLTGIPESRRRCRLSYKVKNTPRPNRKANIALSYHWQKQRKDNLISEVGGQCSGQVALGEANKRGRGFVAHHVPRPLTANFEYQGFLPRSASGVVV